jgi:flagellar operon protein
VVVKLVTNINTQLQSLSQLQEAQRLQQAVAPAPAATQPSQSFKQVLESKVAESDTGIKISSHAEKRLQSRNIELTPEIMARLKAAMDKAQEKGAKETLMVFDNFSLIVSIKNSTVITAMDKEGMKDNVFTNIDSAVIA